MDGCRSGLAHLWLPYDRLRQKLAKAMRKHENFGIISLDMNGLKEINDTYGHRATLSSARTALSWRYLSRRRINPCMR
jgi:predicted signal transduction protein with EAL and GGDEF domain